MNTSISYFVQRIRSLLAASVHHVEPSSKKTTKTTTASSAKRFADLGLHGDALSLATKLDGQLFHLSDLTKTLASWPSKTNKYADKLEALVNSLLERIVTNERKLKALKQADFASLMALWYPDSEWEELKVATAYSVWIFVWDDEIDAGDTDAAVNEELAQEYYKQSLAYIHRMLRLDEEGLPDIEPPNQNMSLFADVAYGIREVTDVEQRQRFYKELENFMDQVGAEHKYRLAGTIPTTEEYMHIRSGSVGCGPQIALTDYMLNMRFPESVMEGPAMKALWKETIYICLILNDVYSVQKEIGQASLLNLVPVMYKNMSVAEQVNMRAVSANVDIALQDSMDRFEAAVTQLDEESAQDAQLQSNLREYVKWCRYFTTGVLFWSLESPRYGMAQCINGDGTLSIVL